MSESTPIIPRDALVVVTGASGFIASHTIHALLRRGFRVRGTVRSAEKGAALRPLFAIAGTGAFAPAVVPDVRDEAALDAALEGAHAVLHIASPLFRKAPPGADAWAHIVEPARDGTLAVLRAAARAGTVQRVVVTSSVAAIVDAAAPPGTVFTERDWNIAAVTKAEAAHASGTLTPFDAYFASKVLAEQAAWDFVAQGAPFDLVTLIPPYVFGPALHAIDAPTDLPTVDAALWGFLTGGDASGAARAPAGPFVDVRDVAEAHVEALLCPGAGGRRISVAEGAHVYQELLDAVRADADLAAAFPAADWGTEGARGPAVYEQDARASAEVLGLRYRPVGETAVDLARNLAELSERLGWVRVPVGTGQ